MIRIFKIKDASTELYKYVSIHNELNPKLWEDNALRPEVESKIRTIVDMFIEMMNEDGVYIMPEDIYILGSNAGYNYTETSDIDIHIMARFEAVNCDYNHLKILYDNYKTLFHEKYAPTIYGYEVEVYVEDITDETNVSTAIYSIDSGSWIRKPLKEQPVLDVKTINTNFEKYKEKIEDLENDITGNDYNFKIQEIDRILDEIYSDRKVGLQRSGEFSAENIVFKELRAKGYITLLKSLKTALKKKIMTLSANVKDSQSQEIARAYENLSKLNHCDIEALMYGDRGYRKTHRSELFESYHMYTDPLFVKEWFDDFAEWFEETQGRKLITSKCFEELL